jgi:hypothetical protein
LLEVKKVDSCSRNTLNFLKLQDKLFKRSITFVALDVPSSDDPATNKLIVTNLATIATEAAKKAGKSASRKTVINNFKFTSSNLRTNLNYCNGIFYHINAI